MSRMNLLVDTNVIVDFLNRREPHFQKARLLMIAARVGEFNVWVTSSQVTDIVYIATNGGQKDLVQPVLERLRNLRLFVNVIPVTDSDIDKMLATTWSDPEDALLVDIALRMKADALITRDDELKSLDYLNVFDCEEFFAWLEREHGISYTGVAL